MGGAIKPTIQYSWDRSFRKFWKSGGSNSNPRPLEEEGFASIRVLSESEGERWGKRDPPLPPYFRRPGGGKAAARGGLSSKLFIIFWWFIAANFELGVISLKLDAHTKRTNERTHWEREAKRERDTFYREWLFFRKKPKQRHWNTFHENVSYNLQKLRPAKTYLNNQGSINERSSKWIYFLIPARASQVWNAMAIWKIIHTNILQI